MLRSFDGLALRELKARPLRAVLTAIGVVLGVGMVFGVLLLVGTIRFTFDNLIDSAFGKQELLISGQAGNLPNSTLDKVQATPGVQSASAMIGAIFTRLDANGKPIKGIKGQMMVAGTDSFARSPYQWRVGEGRAPISGPEIAVETHWARDHGLRLGQTLRVATPSGPALLRIVGTLTLPKGATFGGQGLADMPMADARQLMEMPTGYLQVFAEAGSPSAVEPLRKRLAARLGPGVQVKTPKGWGAEIKKQLDGLNVILYFFSGVALFVGGFLILNNFNMTVLQRMREIGMLRTLGASRRMIARTVLLEALVIGIVGSILGLGLGLGLASGLIAMMRGLGMPIGDLQISAGAAITAVILGIFVTALGAFWPARRAGRIPPIRAALGDTRPRARPSLRRAAVGVVLFTPGVVLGGKLFMGGGTTAAMGGIALTMTMFVGMALLAPFMILPVVEALAPAFRRVFPAGGRLAVDAVRSNAARTAATAAALTIGLSVVVVNSSMSASFIGTVRDQLNRNFARDFNVQAQGYSLEQGGGPGIPKTLRGEIATMPEAAVVTPIRVLLTKLPGGGEQNGMIMAWDPAHYGQVSKEPIKGVDRTAALAAVGRGGVLIGGGYAHRAHLKRGDSVLLTGPAGRYRAPVVGVVNALNEMAGFNMQISLATMKRVYGVTTDAELAIKARNGQAPALERRLNSLITERYQNLELVSAAGRKAEVDREISTQFNFFNAIVAIAVIVSLLGVVNTLAMSVIERTREIGVMRALGASRWLVRRTMVNESLLITLAGAIAGVLAGLLIGFVWVSGLGSIMPGIAFHLPLGTIVGVCVAAVVAGVAAAVLPARRAARLNVIQAVTYE